MFAGLAGWLAPWTAEVRARAAVRAWIGVGMRVRSSTWGPGMVKRINKKSATICETGRSGAYTVAVDLSWLTPDPSWLTPLERANKGGEA